MRRALVLAPIVLLTLWEGLARHRVVDAGLAALASVALYVFLARCASARAATMATLVLATTPAWFAHPDRAGALATIALAAAGLALLDPVRSRRLQALAIGVFAAAAIAGARSGGMLTCASIPLAAVGAAALPRDARRGAIAIAIAAIGAGVAGLAIAKGASFSAPISRLAYAFAPWTPFVPFALFSRPRSGAGLAIPIAACATLAVDALGGSGAPAAVAPIAACVGVVLAEIDEPSPMLAIGVLALGAIVAHDVGLFPERATSFVGGAGDAARAAKALRFAVWGVSASAVFALLLPAGVLRFRGAAIVVLGVVAGGALRAYVYPPTPHVSLTAPSPIVHT